MWAAAVLKLGTFSAANPSCKASRRFLARCNWLIVHLPLVAETLLLAEKRKGGV